MSSTSRPKTKRQRLEETIPSLANHSIGVLWDGEEDNVVDGYKTPQELFEGQCPSANDIRISQLSGKLLDEQCKRFFIESVRGLELSEKLESQLISTLSAQFASILRYANCLAGNGESNLNVNIEMTSVHGRHLQYDNTEVKLYFVDTFSERCNLDLPLFVSEIFESAFEELGFFVQRFGISGFLGTVKSMQGVRRTFRLSWFKPAISEHHRQVEDPSQIDAYIAGVPLDDIFA